MKELLMWLRKIFPRSHPAPPSSTVLNASPREAMQAQCDKFISEMTSAVIGISLKEKSISAHKFTLYFMAPFIIDSIKLEVFSDRVWIERIATTPPRHGHGSNIYNGIAKAALAIDIHRIECRPVSAGLAFFDGRLKFHQANYSSDRSRKGIWEKII